MGNQTISVDAVRKVLNGFITPRYPGLIHDYKVEVENYISNGPDATFVNVWVIVYPEKYEEMETYTGNPFSGLDSKVEKDVRDVLKYLGPHKNNVSLYVFED